MRSERRALLVALALAVAAGGCAPPPEPTPPPEPPAAEQLREDVVGVRFAFFEDEDGPRYWTIEPAEVRRMDVVEQIVDDSGRVARSRVSLTLRAENRSISGDLILRHLRRDSSWVLESAGRAGPNWLAADESATLFAVRTLSDSTLRRRLFALDPVVRYERGAYHDPLASARAAARVLFDSTFATDSLRQSAEAALERRTGGALAPRTVFVLGPGHSPSSARVDSTAARLLGCTSATVFAAPSDPATSAWADLATTSSVMGTPEAPGAPLPRPLARAIETVARQRFETMGIDPGRMRIRRSLAADLDGDGLAEGLGAFVAGTGARQVGLALAVEMEAGQPRLLYERQSPRGAGYGSLDLLGVVDVDADGAAEAFFVEEGTEAYRYLVVTYRAGRFTDAFRGGGSAC